MNRDAMEGIIREWIIDHDEEAMEILGDWAEEHGLDCPRDAAEEILEAGDDEEECRRLALMIYMDCDPEDVDQRLYGNDNQYECCGDDYLVLTDEEADDAAEEQIKQSVWSFNSSFLKSYGVFQKMDQGMIDDLRRERYEDINDTFVDMIGDDWDMFVHDAIASDGRGYFLAQYDHEEREEFGFYIYRT